MVIELNDRKEGQRTAMTDFKGRVGVRDELEDVTENIEQLFGPVCPQPGRLRPLLMLCP